MSPEIFSAWEPFLSMQASAAATLLGLVFVAASINLAHIVSTPALPGRVLESLLQFVQVLFISMVTSIPRQSPTTLAIEVLTVAFLSWVMQVIAFTRYHRAHKSNPRWWLLVRIALAHLAILPFFAFAGSLLLGRADAVYWASPGFFLSFVAGLLNSWVLLIHVGRRSIMSRG